MMIEAASINWLSALLTSSLIAAIISAFVSYLIQHLQHKNKYHESLIQRRCDALNKIEQLIQALKVTIIDSTDKRAYHVFVATSISDSHNVMVLCANCVRDSIWISALSLDLIAEINKMLYLTPQDPVDRIEYAKERYIEISTHRSALERELMREYSDVLNIEKFLSRKAKEESSFVPFVPK